MAVRSLLYAQGEDVNTEEPPVIEGQTDILDELEEQ